MRTGGGEAKSGSCLPDICQLGLPAAAGSLSETDTPSQTSSASLSAPKTDKKSEIRFVKRTISHKKRTYFV